jgi:hypothetical protein
MPAVHDPECTECEHDCPHRRHQIFGAPWCSICDDHWEAGDDDDEETSTTTEGE